MNTIMNNFVRAIHTLGREARSREKDGAQVAGLGCPFSGDDSTTHMVDGSSGVALITALIALSVVTLIGLTLVFVSTTDALIERNNRARVSQAYSAESGCEEARSRMSSILNEPSTPLASPSQWVYIVSSPAVNPTAGSRSSNPYFDAEYRTPCSAALLLSRLTRPGFSWVRIQSKTERWAHYNLDDSGSYLSHTNTNADVPVFFGFSKLLSNSKATQYVNSGTRPAVYAGTPVYQLTVLVRDGEGFRYTTLADISEVPIPPLRAALYSRDAIWIGSANVQISGEDEGGTGSTLDALESQNAITGDFAGIHEAPNSVRPASSFAYDAEAIIKMLRPPVSREIEKVAPGISRGSDGTYVANDITLGELPGEADLSQAIYVEGSLNLSNSKGQGILAVNGDLNITGPFVYYGLIIARGKVSFNGGTLPGIDIHGGVLASSPDGNQNSILSGNTRVSYHAGYIREQFAALGFFRLAYRDNF